MGIFGLLAKAAKFGPLINLGYAVHQALHANIQEPLFQMPRLIYALLILIPPFQPHLRPDKLNTCWTYSNLIALPMFGQAFHVPILPS
jgi:hypothetical protein